MHLNPQVDSLPLLLLRSLQLYQEDPVYQPLGLKLVKSNNNLNSCRVNVTGSTKTSQTTKYQSYAVFYQVLYLVWQGCDAKGADTKRERCNKI